MWGAKPQRRKRRPENLCGESKLLKPNRNEGNPPQGPEKPPEGESGCGSEIAGRMGAQGSPAPSGWLLASV